MAILLAREGRISVQFKDLDARWRVLTEEVITGMHEWRQQHPKATFREIETALDERLARVRARMLEDAALLSRSADLTAEGGAPPVACPDCGTPLEPRGTHTRHLVTDHDQAINLPRTYAFCPQCQKGFFPSG